MDAADATAATPLDGTGPFDGLAPFDRLRDPGAAERAMDRATLDLARKSGGQVLGVAFLIELGFLNGRSKLPGENVYSVLTY